MTPHTIGKNPLQIGKSHLQGVIFCRNFAAQNETHTLGGVQKMNINSSINT
jgi:hypothetical protein